MSVTLVDKAISEALGDKYFSYKKLLRCWFCNKLSKEEFDRRANRLFQPCDLHLHNDLMLAILCSIQLDEMSHSSDEKCYQLRKKPPKKQLKQRFQERIITPPFTPLPGRTLTLNCSLAQSEIHATCRAEQQLPETWMVWGRTLNAAHRAGLSLVDPRVHNVLVGAAEVLLRRILMCMAARRCSFNLKAPETDAATSHVFVKEQFGCQLTPLLLTKGYTQWRTNSWRGISSSPPPSPLTSQTACPPILRSTQETRLTTRDLLVALTKPEPPVASAGLLIEQRPYQCVMNAVLRAITRERLLGSFFEDDYDNDDEWNDNDSQYSEEGSTDDIVIDEEMDNFVSSCNSDGPSFDIQQLSQPPPLIEANRTIMSMDCLVVGSAQHSLGQQLSPVSPP